MRRKIIRFITTPASMFKRDGIESFFKKLEVEFSQNGAPRYLSRYRDLVDIFALSAEPSDYFRAKFYIEAALFNDSRAPEIFKNIFYDNIWFAGATNLTVFDRFDSLCIVRDLLKENFPLVVPALMELVEVADPSRTRLIPEIENITRPFAPLYHLHPVKTWTIDQKKKFFTVYKQALQSVSIKDDDDNEKKDILDRMMKKAARYEMKIFGKPLRPMRSVAPESAVKVVALTK